MFKVFSLKTGNQITYSFSSSLQNPKVPKGDEDSIWWAPDIPIYQPPPQTFLSAPTPSLNFPFIHCSLIKWFDYSF